MAYRSKTPRTALLAAAVLAFVGGSIWLARSVSAQAATLDELYDACAQFAETGTTDALAALGVPVKERDLVEAEFAVDGGKVWVELVEILGEGRKNQCEVRGARRGDIDAIAEPDLSWKDSKVRTDGWFERRALKPGMVKLKVLLLPDNHSLVACPREGEGYALGAGSINMEMTPPVPFAQQPLRFFAARSVHSSRMACRMAGQPSSGNE